ncbi:MAG: hypothetical protein A2Y00_00075 [Omnitrophica WOR_2 bacterium GWF2_43_52]|nr:MAG: hypothetical protein A2062_07625 [Omnitrophica WOR_2 bacterium GWA2_44_7]OGX20671.1 MAG: hypothetical protein A2Y00_00075 [Omnitrophica WOR_2 bacterium GWF2_43_52]
MVIIVSLLFAGAMSNFLIYRYTLRLQFNDLRNKLMIIAQTASLMVDADTLMRIPLNREGMETPEYKAIAEKLEQIKRVNPPIKYAYTLTKTEEEGIWQFIVDIAPYIEKIKGNGVTSYPGDKYKAWRFPEMLKAYNGASADKKLERDEWGVTLSGYAPIRDKDGKAVAVLGVDVTADTVYRIEQAVRTRSLLVLLLGIMVSFVLGMFISGRITKPIHKLVEGTRHIAEGDLQYEVKVKSSNEIGELAKSFNQMAKSLFESKKKLLDFFYCTVQSFVRILEAKDTYTRGHSERVAEYAQQIAVAMQLPPERVKLVKDTALLHDIGKLAIHEHILNKPEKLTDAEWEIVRKHPEIGEEILKPVVLTEEMLAIVRNHHERYDSTGYPDKISGKNINILAAVVTVADAYDAMTSPRAYRWALSKEHAIGELKKNSGTQFHPKVVEAFLKVLEEDDTS